MAHSFAPFGDSLAGVETVPVSGANVGVGERIGSAFAGGLTASYGLSRKDSVGAFLILLGGFLVYRGVTGRCQAYKNLGVDTTGSSVGRGVPGNAGIRVEKTVVVGKSSMELYYFWHQLSNLPAIMPQVKSVAMSGARSHWIVAGPAGHDVSWEAEFITEKPGELIAWQSLPNAEVRNAGSVHFQPIGDGLTTQVKVALEYLPPAGYAGGLVAKIFGAAPEQQLEDALLRFKEYMETKA